MISTVFKNMTGAIPLRCRLFPEVAESEAVRAVPVEEDGQVGREVGVGAGKYLQRLGMEPGARAFSSACEMEESTTGRPKAHTNQELRASKTWAFPGKHDKLERSSR